MFWRPTSTAVCNGVQCQKKDPTTLLILALVGFVGFAGIHRFMINHIGLVILYFLMVVFVSS
jgi:TM2 domain-containing membrane protein YozV